MNASITDIKGLKVGTAEDLQALTGCTVVLAEDGAVCGVDVRGSAPGTRETDLLNPSNSMEQVNAVVLAGGSAYGLEAAEGVMDWLEEQGKGFYTGKTVVPIVPAAVLFDLNVGSYKIRPDKKMGYEAAARAGLEVPEGNYGAGTGATVGKVSGYEYCTKSGQGTFAVELANGLTVGALVAVNAFGDVLDPETGEVIAGVQRVDGKGFRRTVDILKEMFGIEQPSVWTGNTTLAVVASNARLSKAEAQKVAQMAHNGLARSISPIHTTWDGDTVFALATGEVEANVNLVGILSSEVLARAVVRAVKAAQAIQGLKSSRDII
ncbi:MAG: P1 family peptidase [Chitinophagales bacterium]